MFVVLKRIDLSNQPAPKPGAIVPAKTPLCDGLSGPGGAVYGFQELDQAKTEALRLARGYPGNCFEVFELDLVGSAETPIATWVDGRGK